MPKYLSWLAVLVWVLVIFYFSYQPATDSNELSKGVTELIFQTIEAIFPSVEWEITNHFIRKNAHFFIYFVLGMIVTLALKTMRLKGPRCFLSALIICMLFAITDEIHQQYVPGRGGQLTDVGIDSLGALIGIGLFFTISRLRKK